MAIPMFDETSVGLMPGGAEDARPQRQEQAEDEDQAQTKRNSQATNLPEV